MKSKGLEASHCCKKDRSSEDEGNDGNISQNKMHINATSKDSEFHVHKKGSSWNSKKKSSSNGLQFLKNTEMIGSQVQDDTSNLSDTSQCSAGHISQTKSCTSLTEKHLKDEKSPNRNSSFYVEDLSAEDEVYTFQCPENYIRQSPFNQTFDFGTVNKIVDAQTNEVLHLNVLSVENKSLTIAMPRKGKTGVLVKLPLKGHIVIKKIVKTPFHHDITNEDSYVTERDDKLLEGVKSRHPLLGINWKAHIELANKAFKRQNKKIKKEMKKKLKLKKKKTKKIVKKKSEAECLHLNKEGKWTGSKL